MTEGDHRIARARKTLAGCISIAILGAFVVAGWWPFHHPRNAVSWLENGMGLSLRSPGVLWTSAEWTSLPRSPNPVLRSMDMWLQPDVTDQSGTILAFETKDAGYFSVRQSLTDLSLEGPARGWRHARYLPNIFKHHQAVFLTIASGAPGAAVYVNGVFTKVFPQFRLSTAEPAGRLVLGASPFTDDCWRGQLRGLALYDRELSADEARTHFRNWTLGRTDVLRTGNPLALYRFDEGAGALAHDRSPSHFDLVIPSHFEVLHPQFLEPFWRQFRFDRAYWEDIVVNIAGFLPFGFFVCAYLSDGRNIRRAMWLTLILGAMVSFTIEAVQTYLPTRCSDTTDLITNTLGTFLGVLLYRARFVRLLYGRCADRMTRVFMRALEPRSTSVSVARTGCGDERT